MPMPASRSMFFRITEEIIIFVVCIHIQYDCMTPSLFFLLLIAATGIFFRLDRSRHPEAGYSGRPCRKEIWWQRGVFFVFAWWFLGVYNAEVLYKTQNYSLFICHDLPFFTDMMSQPGGLLVYISRYLTQFFYYPLLGAGMVALCLSGIAWLVSVLAQLPKRLLLLEFLPSSLLLLAQTTVGYYIYLHWEPASLFLLPLGMFMALSAFALYRRISPCLRIAVGCLIIVFVYGISGAWVGLTLICMIGYHVRHRSEMPRWPAVLYAVIALCCVWAGHGGIYMMQGRNSLMAPLPVLTFLEPALCTYFALLAAVILCGVCCGTSSATSQTDTTGTLGTAMTQQSKAATVQPKTARRTAPYLLIAGCMVIFFLSYRDPLFRAELQLQHQFEERDWDGMLETADRISQPTRAVAAYRTIALAYGSGFQSLSRHFFDYCYDYQPVRCRLEVPEQMIYYADFELCASVPNSAFRWNAEFAALYGQRPALMKSMVTAALLNREIDLATKYIKIINLSTFHKIWALRMAPYINDIHLLSQDPFMEQLIDYLPTDDTIENFNGITHIFSYTGDDPTRFEQNLVTALYFKRMDLFCAKLSHMPEEFLHRMPPSFQEAIAFAGLSIDSSYLEKYPIDSYVLEQVKRFQAQLNRTDDWESAKEALKPEFGSTVPYFLIFSTGTDYTFPEIGTRSALY